jgi:hypothetical protein
MVPRVSNSVQALLAPSSSAPSAAREVLDLLALLVQKYKCWRTILTRTLGRSTLSRRGGVAHFTCFTRTKVQMLTQELQRQRPQTSPATPATERTKFYVVY